MLNRKFSSLVHLIPNIRALSTIPQPKLKLDKILVVSKFCRLELEKKSRNLSDDDLKSTMQEEGIDYHRLLRHHDTHYSFLEKLMKTMNMFGLKYEVVNRFNFTDQMVERADLVMSVGGDGTFLLAARKVFDNQKPIVGFNSDPSGSEGRLCLPSYFSSHSEEAFDKFSKGNFKWLMRNRIRTHLHGEKDEMDMHHKSDNVPCLALNEVYIGEYQAAKVSSLEVWLGEDKSPTILKCSGVVLASGTGSTAWLKNIISVTEQNVFKLLKLLNLDASQSNVRKVVKEYNQFVAFDPEKLQIGYVIRELILSGMSPIPRGIVPTGFCTQVKVKSRCYQGTLIADGTMIYPFKLGMVAELKMHPKDALRTVAIVQ